MNKQNGSALIISLIILLVMTMLGITSMSTSTLEEKMAANDRNQKITFQNAELTLDDGEASVIDSDWMEDLNAKIVGDNAGYYELDEDVDYYNKANWVSEGSLTCILPDPVNDQGNNKACYIIEHVSDEMPLNAGGGYGQLDDSTMAYKILKVSANSTDSNGDSSSTVQGTTRKAFIPNP